MTIRKYTADDIQGAHFTQAPGFARSTNGGKGKKGAKGNGLRYEARVQEHLSSLSEWYLPGPWILYIVGGRPQWCQPDGLHLDYQRGIITIIEIKLSHTADAARQLRGVYEPVVRRLFPRPMWGVKVVEITRWYDPDIAFPEAVSLLADPFWHPGTNIGVHIWRP